MKPPHPLDRLFCLARQSRLQGCPPPAVAREDVAFFARRVAAAWAREDGGSTTTLRLWELAGRWSLVTAAVVVLLVVVWRPHPAGQDLLAPFTEEAGSDPFWFEPQP